MHFLARKLLYLDSTFTEICSQEYSQQHANIGLDDGLEPIRCQAINQTNDGLAYSVYMHHSTLMV